MLALFASSASESKFGQRGPVHAPPGLYRSISAIDNSANVVLADEMEPMKKGTSRALAKEQKAEIKALANLPDEKIDTTDIPEILDWSGAKRGLLYRPVKRQITLRLDADVVAWFRANAPGGRGYQTEINRVLREHARR